MKRILLLTLLSAFPFYALVVSAAPPKKEAEPVPEKKIEPKKKYTFIGKLLKKEKIEAGKKEGDKKDGEKKGKKGKKGKRSHLLKFEITEVITGDDELKPGLVLLCATAPGPLRNPKQVKGAQIEPGAVYRVISSAKLVKEDKVLRLADCRLFSAKGRVGDEYKVGKTWKGILPVKTLELFPEAQRQSPISYLGDNKSFTAFWDSFKAVGPKGDFPNVDFSKNVVVVVKNIRHMEQIDAVKARLDKGVLRVSAKKNFEFEGRKVKDQVFAAFFILPRKDILSLASGKNHLLEIKPPGFIYAD